MKRAVVFLFLWFAIAFSLSFSNWLDRFAATTLFGFGAIAIVLGFTVLYQLEPRIRGTVPVRNLRRLTYGQMLRFYGTLALFMAYRHILPAAFAVPTALMDIAIASSSFYVAKHFAPERDRPSPVFYLWHIAGVTTIVISNVLVFLTATPKFGLVSDSVTSQSMATFPMSIVPTFIGPLVLILHLLAIFDGRRQIARLQSDACLSGTPVRADASGSAR